MRRRFIYAVVLASLTLWSLPFGPDAAAQSLVFQEFFMEAPPPVRFGEAGWADYDGDGDYDLMLTGSLRAFDKAVPHTQLYRNDGETTLLIENPNTGATTQVPAIDYVDALNLTLPILEDVWQSAVAWADYDGDGDLDVAVSGLTAQGNASLRVYENIGGTELLASRFELTGLRSGDLAWADVDNDGDYDLLACGTNQNNQPTTTLYHNQTTATASFVPQPGTGLDHLDACSADFGDYDGDGDQDLLLTGTTAQQAFLTRIYRNDGGSFTAVGAGLKGLVFATGSWGDYDADGDLDVLVSGGRLTPFMLEGQIKVYRNDGGSVFTDVSDGLVGSFENDVTLGRYQGDAAWGDFTNNGLLDFFVAGAKEPLSTESLQFYQNGRNDEFDKAANERFDGGLFGNTVWGDYDGDRDLDVFVVGEAPGRDVSIRALRNGLAFGNLPPEAPEGLQAIPQGDAVTLSWNPGDDFETRTPGLGYNLRVGTTPGASDVVSPMALDSGRRLLSRRGNVDHALRWRLRGLAPGTYYWSVQALDNSYAGSAFAPEASFTIPPAGLTVLQNGYSFGECLGYCKAELALYADSLTFTRYSWEQEDTVRHYVRPMDPALWNSFVALINFEALNPLPNVLGCPDCDDGGAEWLDVTYDGQHKRIRFEYSDYLDEYDARLEPIGRLLEELRQLRVQLDLELYPLGN